MNKNLNKQSTSHSFFFAAPKHRFLLPLVALEQEISNMRLPKLSASGTGAQCAAGVAGDSLQDYLLALVALCPPSP